MYPTGVKIERGNGGSAHPHGGSPSLISSWRIMSNMLNVSICVQNTFQCTLYKKDQKWPKVHRKCQKILKAPPSCTLLVQIKALHIEATVELWIFVMRVSTESDKNCFVLQFFACNHLTQWNKQCTLQQENFLCPVLVQCAWCSFVLSVLLQINKLQLLHCHQWNQFCLTPTGSVCLNDSTLLQVEVWQCQTDCFCVWLLVGLSMHAWHLWLSICWLQSSGNEHFQSVQLFPMAGTKHFVVHSLLSSVLLHFEPWDETVFSGSKS